jgi:hypothetical protein
MVETTNMKRTINCIECNIARNKYYNDISENKG